MDRDTNIFLVHGLGNGWSLLPLKFYLKSCGFCNTKLIFYPSGSLSFDECMTFVDSEIEKIVSKKSGEEIVVIGQSMGGVVANSLHEMGWKLALGIYIGSPLNGARLISKVERLIPNWMADLLKKPAHEFLKDKGDEEKPPHAYKTVSMGWGWSGFDHCVFRDETAIDKANHIHLNWADHSTIFLNPRLWFLVKGLLDDHQAE